MEDVIKNFREEICIFCYKHRSDQCMNLRIEKDLKVKTYKCLNFIKESKMKEFKKYLKYSFYDENKKLTAIIKEETPKKIIQELKKEYDIVKYKED